MTIADRAAAADALRRLGYYRLSGYWYPYRRVETQPDGSLSYESDLAIPIRFEHVLEIAEFDRIIRMKIFEALEMVEVAFRTAIAERLGPRDAFAHRDPGCLDPDFAAKARKQSKRNKRGDHGSWIKELDRLERRSEEAFAKHQRQRYGGPFPIWMSVQVMSFGALSTLFSGLQPADRSRIATDFDLISADGDGDGAALASWLNHFRHVRNLCAHHSRLWNRNFDVVLGEVTGVPELTEVRDKVGRRLYGTLLALRFLIARIDPSSTGMTETAEFADREGTRLGLDLESMGFPMGWSANRMWDPNYRPDLIVRQRIRKLRQVASVQRSDLARLLTALDYANARGKVGYLHKRHALIGAKVHRDGARLFPDFQIDRRAGDFRPQVLSANRKLFMMNHGTDDEDRQWVEIDWWSEPNDLLRGHTPIEALLADELDQPEVERLLPGPEE